MHVAHEGLWSTLGSACAMPAYTRLLMQDSVSSTADLHEPVPPGPWLARWWRKQPASRQDRFAMLAPLLAVVLFLAAIVTAFSYLRLEEEDRELEAVKRDVEYAQQR